MKRLLGMTLSLTLLFTLFTFNTYAANLNYNDTFLESSNYDIDYAYSFNDDTGKLTIRMGTNKHIRMHLRFKAKVYDRDGFCLDTFEASDYTNWLSQRYQVCLGSRTIKIYYYVDDRLKETKYVRL
ncbi:hypothetical protein [Vallitalea guaymasensis]|uniref:hypothetical protein n=1 Tax=Vallitalea guaymasensis TaxID=1185412 RepID=UPI000DE3EA65|nr:hypothetical protein [Vallitalea guaymasensis]